MVLISAKCWSMIFIVFLNTQYSGFNYFQSHEGNEAKISEQTLAPSPISLCLPFLPLFLMTTENDEPFPTMMCVTKLCVIQFPPKEGRRAKNLGTAQNSLFDLSFFGWYVCVCVSARARTGCKSYICVCEQSAESVQ